MRQLTLWHRAAPWRAAPTGTPGMDAAGAAAVQAAALPPLDGAAPPEAVGGAAAYPGTADEGALARWFSGALHKPVALQFTCNRSTMVSYRTGAMGVRLRLHRIFLNADAELMLAVLGFVRGERGAARRLDRFIEAQASAVPTASPVTVRTRGTVHDLAAIFNELNAAYFHGACRASITWGPQARPRGRHSLQLGVYLYAYRLICVHPCLDQSFVPRFYLAWVVFHEMLHELFGIAHHVRRRLHPPEFVAVETSHPDYARCRAWEAEHLGRLLQYRPPPAPPSGVRRRRAVHVA